MEFNQQFSLAPIKTAHAELVIDIMDEKVKRKRGAAKLALQDLLSQKETRKTLSVQRKAKDGSDAKTQGNAVVYIKAQFQYSKVRPLKDRIYNLLEEQRKLQRDVTNLQLGKELEYKWAVSGREQGRGRGVRRRVARPVGCVPERKRRAEHKTGGTAPPRPRPSPPLSPQPRSHHASACVICAPLSPAASSVCSVREPHGREARHEAVRRARRALGRDERAHVAHRVREVERRLEPLAAVQLDEDRRLGLRLVDDGRRRARGVVVDAAAATAAAAAAGAPPPAPPPPPPPPPSVCPAPANAAAGGFRGAPPPPPSAPPPPSEGYASSSSSPPPPGGRSGSPASIFRWSSASS